MTPAADPVQQRRDLRAIVSDGVFFSAMVGLGETYVPAFALAAGLGEVAAGLVATAPMLAGALLQLVTPRAVRRLRSYRRWVVSCAALQALSFVPLVAGALQGRIRLEWLFLASVAYWAFGMATGPAWNAWVTSLVPSERRARFFAGRTRAAQASLLLGVVSGGAVLEAGGGGGGSGLAFFAILFGAAMLARLVSAACLARQSEAPGLAREHRFLRPRGVLRSVRQAGSTRVLAYLLAMQIAVHVAAPYFTPYMLGPLDLSYGRFTALLSAAFVARIAVLPLLGRMAESRGTRFLLWWGAVGIVPLPVLWLVSHDFLYLLVLQLASGTAWAALEFAMTLSFFEGIEQRDRTSVLTVFNVANAVAIALGGAIGGQLFLHLGGSPAGYAWLFAISSTARIATLVVLRGVPGAHRIRRFSFRTLAVRPSAGAVERPILASEEDDERQP